MDQIVDFERRIELALDEIERFVSEYSISPSLKTERDNDRLQDLAAENQLLTAQIESLKTQHNNELQALIAEREEERETVKSLYKRLTEVVESPWRLKPMPELKLSIGERDFEVACQEGEEKFLTEAANLLNAESQKLVSQLGRLSESRMLLMAGLMLADKMINAEKSLNERERQIEQKEIELERSISAARVGL
jgi:cell division protein ZapA